MYIGIVYDTYTNDSWHRIEKDIYSLKEALKTIRLPLPVACIFDTLRNDFVEIDEAYLRYRKELLEKARRIAVLSLRQSKLNLASIQANTNLPKGRQAGPTREKQHGLRQKEYQRKIKQ
jgi:hypothetical protein